MTSYFDGRAKQPLNYAANGNTPPKGRRPETDAAPQPQSRTPARPAERKKLYEQIAALVLKDRPIVYLYHRNWLWAYTNKLGACARAGRHAARRHLKLAP